MRCQTASAHNSLASTPFGGIFVIKPDSSEKLYKIFLERFMAAIYKKCCPRCKKDFYSRDLANREDVSITQPGTFRCPYCATIIFDNAGKWRNYSVSGKLLLACVIGIFIAYVSLDKIK
jgi:hypothetical protein